MGPDHKYIVFLEKDSLLTKRESKAFFTSDAHLGFVLEIN